MYLITYLSINHSIYIKFLSEEIAGHLKGDMREVKVDLLINPSHLPCVDEYLDRVSSTIFSDCHRLVSVLEGAVFTEDQFITTTRPKGNRPFSHHRGMGVLGNPPPVLLMAMELFWMTVGTDEDGFAIVANAKKHWLNFLTMELFLVMLVNDYPIHIKANGKLHLSSRLSKENDCIELGVHFGEDKYLEVHTKKFLQVICRNSP
nr:MAG TPA: hypothetical protein [Caudoviricetes sp.]